MPLHLKWLRWTPLVGAFLLSLFLSLPAFAATNAVPPPTTSTTGAPASCSPIVQIGMRQVNWAEDAIHLDVSPCAITALQQGHAITVQSDHTLSRQLIAPFAPAITHDLHWRTHDILSTASTCPGQAVTIAIPMLTVPLLGPGTPVPSIELLLQAALPGGPPPFNTSPSFTPSPASPDQHPETPTAETDRRKTPIENRKHRHCLTMLPVSFTRSSAEGITRNQCN
jgi:hypothetical protein